MKLYSHIPLACSLFIFQAQAIREVVDSANDVKVDKVKDTVKDKTKEEVKVMTLEESGQTGLSTYVEPYESYEDPSYVPYEDPSYVPYEDPNYVPYQGPNYDPYHYTIASTVCPGCYFPDHRWKVFGVDPYDLGPIEYTCDPEKDGYEYCCTRYAVFAHKLEGPAWEEQSKVCKTRILWENITAQQTPNFWPLDGQLEGHYRQKQSTTFTHYGDTLPGDRVKYIHPSGLTGLVEFSVDYYDHPFTGIFKEGCKGIIRISDLSVGIDQKIKMTPSFAIKCPRSYRPSANMFGAVKGGGVNHWDFFRDTFSTSIDPSDNQCDFDSNGRHALDATAYITSVSVWDMAEYDVDGYKYEEVVSPFKLYYEPLGIIDFPDYFHGDWIDDLVQIVPGTKLWRTVACYTPEECYPIGYITLLSELYTSKWGDNEMFFKHSPMEEDIYFRPEVKNWIHGVYDTPTFIETGGPTVAYPQGEYNCPFAFIYEGFRAVKGLAQPWEIGY